MEKFIRAYAAVAAMTIAAVTMPSQAAADDIVFSSDIPSRAVVSEIKSIGYPFPGFCYVYVKYELCEVSFGGRKLAPGEYSLNLKDGGRAFFSVSFRSPLKADVPTELTILFNPECLWLRKNWESEEVVTNDTPISLTYTVAPEATNDVALSLASVNAPNDQGELGFVIDGVTQNYNRFYLMTEAPDILSVGAEAPNVTISGPEGYYAEAILNQAYGTAENMSYFYFWVEETPTALGDYSITVSANAVADELHLRNPEFGRYNAETEINFKMVERTVGVEQVTVSDSGNPPAAFTLGGVRVQPGKKNVGVTVSQDGTKIIW